MRTMRRRKEQRHRGQSTVELALVLPIVVILLLGAVDVSEVLSTQQRLENAAYEAALHLSTNPTFSAPARLKAYIQSESGLSPVSAGSTYGLGGAGADQVVVTATYGYPLILPGLRTLQVGAVTDGYFHIAVSSSGIAATTPPTVTDTAGAVKVVPPGDTTVPSGLALTCTLYQNGTAVPTPQPCASSGATWSHTPLTTTSTYTATVMQVNGLTSPPSTPVTGP